MARGYYMVISNVLFNYDGDRTISFCRDNAEISIFWNDFSELTCKEFIRECERLYKEYF